MKLGVLLAPLAPAPSKGEQVPLFWTDELGLLIPRALSSRVRQYASLIHFLSGLKRLLISLNHNYKIKKSRKEHGFDATWNYEP